MSGVSFDLTGGIARVTLDREDAGNAINVAVAQALLDTAMRCVNDKDIRVVVLSGAGKMFCVGGDIRGFAEAGDDLPGFVNALTAPLHAAISKFARMDKPLVTAINGAAAGAGLSLALLGDIAIATKSASFTAAYPGVGLSPDGGMSFLLPRVVGLRRAQEMILLNTRITAEEAAAAGIVTRVVDDTDFQPNVAETVAKLAAMPTRALGRARQLLVNSFGNALEAQLELEARAIEGVSGEPDAREGVAAFLGRRKPNFTGIRG